VLLQRYQLNNSNTIIADKDYRDSNLKTYITSREKSKQGLHNPYYLRNEYFNKIIARPVNNSIKEDKFDNIEENARSKKRKAEVIKVLLLLVKKQRTAKQLQADTKLQTIKQTIKNTG
jgi:predicted amidophosphoribosyltransferase